MCFERKQITNGFKVCFLSQHIGDLSPFSEPIVPDFRPYFPTMWIRSSGTQTSRS